MNKKELLAAYLKEMQAEATATRKCLERISESTYAFKPHPKSMEMGYLVLLVAEIPLWITHTIEKGEIDFATFKHAQPKNTKEILDHFEQNLQSAVEAMNNATDDQLNREFVLKANGQKLFSAAVMDSIGSTLNHWVHHRGQLTVYMRLNEIAVPSIYGPSADEKQYTDHL
ncbi:MAG: type IVB secretion system protein IcmQ [Ferruginibacter sp.]